MTEVRSLDLTGMPAPALSTTSDMPKPGDPKPEPPKGAVSEEEIKSGTSKEVPKTDAKTDDKAKDDKKTPEKTDAKADDKSAEGDKSKEGDKDETPAWQKREITKARNRQREAEARATALEDRLDKALTALERAATRTDTEVKTQAPDPRPARKDFDDPDKYDEALITWSAKTSATLTQAQIEQKQKDAQAESERTKTEERQRSTMKERAEAWNKAAEKAEEKYPDFQEVVYADDVKITSAMSVAIMEETLDGGDGHEIAYYLGTHKDEAAKIAALPTNERQQLAIGRLAERLSAQAKAAPKVTKAPDPVKPIGSKARATEKTAADESMEEYAARRNAELRANPH